MNNMKKRILWAVAGFFILIGFIGFWIAGLVFGFIKTKTYIFTVSYPAAVYTEDGGKIVFLEHREMRWEGHWMGTWAEPHGTIGSKTYLGVMDKDGGKKRIVGETPDVNPAAGGAPTAFWKGEKVAIGGPEKNMIITFETLSGVRKDFNLAAPDKLPEDQWVHMLTWTEDGDGLLVTTKDRGWGDPRNVYRLWKLGLDGNLQLLRSLTTYIDARTLGYQEVPAIVKGKIRGAYFFRPPWWKL